MENNTLQQKQKHLHQQDQTWVHKLEASSLAPSNIAHMICRFTTLNLVPFFNYLQKFESPNIKFVTHLYPFHTHTKITFVYTGIFIYFHPTKAYPETHIIRLVFPCKTVT